MQVIFSALYSSCVLFVLIISKMPLSRNTMKRKFDDAPTKTKKKRKVESDSLDSDPFGDRDPYGDNNWVTKLKRINPGANFPTAH